MDSAARRLSACIGYSIRQAKKGGRSDVAQPLWQALYVVTTPDKAPEPISLFSALGFDGKNHHELNGAPETHSAPSLTSEQEGTSLTSLDHNTTQHAPTAKLDVYEFGTGGCSKHSCQGSRSLADGSGSVGEKAATSV